MEYNDNRPKELVYYDDPNDLVERFMKLEASKHVGEKHNQNEIHNILLEL